MGFLKTENHQEAYGSAETTASGNGIRKILEIFRRHDPVVVVDVGSGSKIPSVEEIKADDSEPNGFRLLDTDFGIETTPEVEIPADNISEVDSCKFDRLVVLGSHPFILLDEECREEMRAD